MFAIIQHVVWPGTSLINTLYTSYTLIGQVLPELRALVPEVLFADAHEAVYEPEEILQRLTS